MEVLFEIFAVVATEIVIVFVPVLIAVMCAVPGIPVAIGLIPTTYPVTLAMLSTVFGELFAPVV